LEFKKIDGGADRDLNRLLSKSMKNNTITDKIIVKEGKENIAMNNLLN
jgi:hypothetical protein